MPNYQNGRVYKIIDYTNNDIYIGSTTQTTIKRLQGHIHGYKAWKRKPEKKGHIRSYDIIKNGDYDIEILEFFPCSNNSELKQREKHYILTLKCINKAIPARTRKETVKAYDDSHKVESKARRLKFIDKKREYDKLYNLENREHKHELGKKYRERTKAHVYEKHVCECSGSYCLNSKSTHLKTTKHRDYIKSLQK